MITKKHRDAKEPGVVESPVFFAARPSKCAERMPCVMPSPGKLWGRSRGGRVPIFEAVPCSDYEGAVVSTVRVQIENAESKQKDKQKEKRMGVCVNFERIDSFPSAVGIMYRPRWTS
jgi:hypothetical protein